ncbi:MAG: DUF3459 domain-containing protein, partial [Stellaceae bacterium]
GEEWGSSRPFPYFCNFAGELADAVRAGRKREFESFPGFAGELPDPCAEATFLGAKLDWAARDEAQHRRWLEWYESLLAIRRRAVAPLLRGVEGGAGRYALLGERAVRVRWRLKGGAVWSLHANFADAALPLAAAPDGELVFATATVGASILPARAALFHLAHG